MYWVTFPWPWRKVSAVAWITKNLLVCAIKIRTTQRITAKLGNAPSHGYYLIKLWRSSVGNCYFGKFSLKISDVFFQGQTLFWPYRRNGWSDWCETKMKCIGWILGTICDRILGTICDLDLWPHSWSWHWLFQGQISKKLYLVGLIDVKWKAIELIWYWADCMTLPFDHTHDLDLGVSMSESELALSQEWGGRST